MQAFDDAHRDEHLVILEGFHAIKHAIRFGASITSMVSPDAGLVSGLARSLAADVHERIAGQTRIITPALFKKLVARPVDTALLAIARRPSFDERAVLQEPRNRPVVLVERAAHLGNLGAIVRSSAAAGAHAVITLDEVDPWHPSALRGSAGLHFALPVGRIDKSLWMAAPPRPLWAIDPAGEPLGDTPIPDQAVLAFGSERQGLSAEIHQQADRLVSIPMEAGVSSLNLAASVAVMLYCWRLGTC